MRLPARFRSYASLVILAVTLAALTAPHRAAQAAVTTFTVAAGAVYVNDDGNCGLAEAIINANNDALTHDDCPAASLGTGGPFVIELTNATYTIDASIPATYTGVNGTNSLPVINASTTINGNNSTLTRDSGAPNLRLLEVRTGVDLTINNLTLSGGLQDFGGAIYNEGTLTVNNSTFSGNSAGTASTALGGAVYNLGAFNATSVTFSGNSAGDEGGALFNDTGATANISGSTFSNNTTTRAAGAIGNSGATMTITNSTFTNNQSVGDIGNGGAIQNLSGGNVTITGSTFSNNTGDARGGAVDNRATMSISGSTFTDNSADDGGALANRDAGSSLTLTNSVLSGNTASPSGGGNGGGIFTQSALTVTGSTFTSNSADNGGGIYVGTNTAIVTNSTFSSNTANTTGAGIANTNILRVAFTTFANNGTRTESGATLFTSSGDTTHITNSIVADSTAGLNCITEGTLNAIGVNLSSDATCIGFTLASTSPQLGLLADNGGPTQTHLPATGSPAINAATSCTNTQSGAVSVDQRGVARPQGANCDLGSVEVGITLDVSKTATPTTVFEPGEIVTFEVDITNTVGAEITVVDITDDVYGSLNADCGVPFTIAASDTDTCTFDRMVSGSAGDSITNTVTVSATYNSGADTVIGSDDATVNVLAVNIGLTLDANGSPTSVDEPGGDVTFTLTITNPSATDPVNVNTLTSSLHGSLNGQGTCVLPVNLPASTDYTCTYQALVSGTGSQTVSNIITATGEDFNGRTVQASDSVDVTIIGVPTPPGNGGGAAEDDDDDGEPAQTTTFVCDNLAATTGGAMTATGSVGNVSAFGQTGNTYCRVIAQDSAFVTSAAEIGSIELINRGVIQAVDLFGLLPNGVPVVPFSSPVSVCLRGSGQLVFIDAADAARSIQGLPTLSSGGYTCADLFGSGTVVLVNGEPAPAATSTLEPNTPPQAQAVGADCTVIVRQAVRLRAEPNTSSAILAVLPFETRYQATERVPGWFRVIWQDTQGWVSAEFVTPDGNCGG